MMVRFTLAQMRRSLGRLASAGIAIVLGSAFVAATLVAGDLITRSSYDVIAAPYARADLVVSVPEQATDDQLRTLRDLPTVAAAEPLRILGATLGTGSSSTFQQVGSQPQDPRLDAQTVVEGRAPISPGEIAVPRSVLELLDLEIGDEVPVTWSSQEDGSPTREDLTVVGTLDDPYGAYEATGGLSRVAPAEFADAEAVATTFWSGREDVLVALRDGSDLSSVRVDVADALPGVEVSTVDEKAQSLLASQIGERYALTAVVLAFAAIALTVAGLVIANTFQVLVAQRTRSLALLRCVGATRRQLRRSVLLEAGLLGVAAAATGVLLGVGLAQGTLSVLRALDLDVPLPPYVHVGLWTVLVPLLVGTAVTMLSALSPARAATRVAPLAALRPLQAPGARGAGGHARIAATVTLVVVGALLLGGGVFLGLNGSLLAGLAASVLGCFLSFLGLLIGAPLWVPGAVRLVGRTLSSLGSPGRLAAANAMRNPRRTAATSTALLIGVTLVMTMSTGAASARASLSAVLENTYPVDAQVDSYGVADDGSARPLPPAVVREIESLDGVGVVVPVTTTMLELTVDAEGLSLHTEPVTGPTADEVMYERLKGIAPEDLQRVARMTIDDSLLQEGTLLVPPRQLELWDRPDGQRIRVDGVGPDGGSAVELRLKAFDGLDLGMWLATPATAAQLGDPVEDSLWIRFATGADAAAVAPEIEQAVSGIDAFVTSPGLERAMLERVIDTLLAIVVGLLGVAVVIALIGVANTLSLSILERRRESATLRAIGLSRRQLRGSLALEGMLISTVGGVLGILVGLAYGWGGAATILGGTGEIVLAVPTREILLVLLVSVVAGCLASVIPARQAARTSPVAALAVE